MKNEGESWVTSYGSYKGGELWIEERDPRKSRIRGLVPPPNPRKNEEERGLLGKMVCTKGQWVQVQSKIKACCLSSSRGEASIHHVVHNEGMGVSRRDVHTGALGLRISHFP